MRCLMKKKSKLKNTGLAVAAVAAVGGGMFQFGTRSNNNLETVCLSTQQLAQCAILKTEVDFMVIEGYRPQERQVELYAQGRTKPGRKVTWTLNSRHTSGRAIDIVALEGGEIDWSPEPYKEINKAFEACSQELDIEYVWGGTFKGRDWGHFETEQCFTEKQKVDI